MSSKELYSRAVRENKQINLAIVYDNLTLFKDIGLIKERIWLERVKRYDKKLYSSQKETWS
ncbi:transcriptional repressor [bacterium]|nr:transcriptional repressor [bacterium]